MFSLFQAPRFIDGIVLLTFDPSGVNPSDTLRVSEAPLLAKLSRREQEARHLLYAGEPVHRNGSLLTFDFREAVDSHESFAHDILAKLFRNAIFTIFCLIDSLNDLTLAVSIFPLLTAQHY